MHGLPAFDRMTGGAVRAQASLVRVIRLVTRETVLIGRLQLGDGMRAKMAS